MPSRRKYIRKATGFTLVELLIVIVVIGVLSAMMMLSSTEAVSSAKASNIVSNLTTMKKAVLAWYTDNYHRVEKNNAGDYLVDYNGKQYYLGQFAQFNNGAGEKEFAKYIGNSNIPKMTKDKNTKPGEFLLATEKNKWYVGYDVGDDMRLREKLAAKTKSLNLEGATKKTTGGGVDTDNIHPYTVSDQKVYMLILKF